MPSLTTSIVGYPRIGARRELKKWVEDYFKGKLSQEELLKNSAGLRQEHWSIQSEKGIDFIPSNDFSFYDTFLDTAFLLNVIPENYRRLNFGDLDTYFAMAKGYQQGTDDVKAFPMKKWFNTNYHYLVPAIGANTQFKLNSTKPFDEYCEAAKLGIKTKPVLIGAFTFLKLSRIEQPHKKYTDYIDEIVDVYRQIFDRFNQLDVDLVQIDEPVLVTDLSPEDLQAFMALYQKLLKEKNHLQVLLQTYFGDLRDVYDRLLLLDFDAVGLDLVEGPKNLELIEKYGFPGNKKLFAGVVNGKNIWKNNYSDSLKTLSAIKRHVAEDKIVLSTSCSLLHVPYTVKNETALAERFKIQLAFAEEKMDELRELAELFHDRFFERNEKYLKNSQVLKEKRQNREYICQDVREKIDNLSDDDFQRRPVFEERNKLQKKELKLPLLPTTTIGSFPQTPELRKLRKWYKEGRLSFEEYDGWIKRKIGEIIRLQEEIGLDVLVHGEFERNDMVEYFGQNLSGFLLTENGWVQSYGTRCVKPPIIFGDVKRRRQITVDYITYAQQLTDKPVKGMLTGPVTILNWSFPREDLSLAEIAYQIALAVRAEVLDLEANGIRIIQIDEAALREKLPLRKEDWRTEYLDWAIKAFRLTHTGVKPETQIHTHMCYSEFEDIIQEIDAMDADVISFEAARSDLSIIEVLEANGFRTEVGPGVYDIHSPRVPKVEELQAILEKMAARLRPEKLWVNPDCGLKTRTMEETIPSLRNLVAAAQKLRKRLS